MTPEEIHEWIERNWSQQSAVTPQSCPEGRDKNDWKNRHRVSAKLRPENYSDLMAFCRRYGYSANTAINQIFSFFFTHLNDD